jgi:hypothetical protein
VPDRIIRVAKWVFFFLDFSGKCRLKINSGHWQFFSLISVSSQKYTSLHLGYKLFASSNKCQIELSEQANLNNVGILEETLGLKITLGTGDKSYKQAPVSSANFERPTARKTTVRSSGQRALTDSSARISDVII